MTDHEKDHALREHSLEGEIPCHVCLKEIPKSLAHIFEGEDYVRYFCGLDCFKQWEQGNEAKKRGNTNKLK